MARKKSLSTSSETDLSASTHDHNKLVTVEALCLISLAGDPVTGAGENYAPRGYEHPDANEADTLALHNLPSQFEIERITAEGWAKAGLVRIVEKEVEQ